MIQYLMSREMTRLGDVWYTGHEAIQNLYNQEISQSQKRTLELCMEERQEWQGTERSDRYVESPYRLSTVSHHDSIWQT